MPREEELVHVWMMPTSTPMMTFVRSPRAVLHLLRCPFFQDEDWTAEERAHQGFTAEEFGALSEMLGPRGVNFDNDDEPVPDEIDFAGDPILGMDMVVRSMTRSPKIRVSRY